MSVSFKTFCQLSNDSSEKTRIDICSSKSGLRYCGSYIFIFRLYFDGCVQIIRRLISVGLYFNFPTISLINHGRVHISLCVQDQWLEKCVCVCLLEPSSLWFGEYGSTLYARPARCSPQHVALGRGIPNPSKRTTSSLQH